MTPHTMCPLLWDGRRFRPIADVLPDLADWDEESPGQRNPLPHRATLDLR